jgi:hypothetical protein
MLTIIAPVSAGTIHVYPGDDVRAKIISAASGDTIYVHAGTYIINIDTFIQNKSLTIIGDGASTTIIYFNGLGRLNFNMSSGPSTTVNILGITFKDGVSGAALVFNNTISGTTMNVNISDCIFDNSSVGVYIVNSVVLTIENSELKNANTGIGNYGGSAAPHLIVKNCLIHDNVYGIYSTNTSGQTTVQSCTIYNNTSEGVHVANSATATIKDSIITNNSNYGIYKDNSGATVTCTYNNVWNNGTDYSGATAGAGSISQNPSFAIGRLGDYYLSRSSPCVDKGSTSAVSLGLDKMTTRTDERWDTGTVDMGYHYVSNWLGKRGLPIAQILEILNLNK